MFIWDSSQFVVKSLDLLIADCIRPFVIQRDFLYIFVNSSSLHWKCEVICLYAKLYAYMNS